MTVSPSSSPSGPTDGLPAAAPSDRGSRLDRVPQWVLALAIGLIGLGIWQLIISLQLVSRIILPSPGDTAREIAILGANIAAGDYVWPALLTTAEEAILGFLAAGGLGFALGVLVGETRFGQRAVMPYLVGFNALPKVAFAPVFVAWFGFGVSSKVVMALFIAFFPVIVDTAAGLASVDRDAIDLFRSFKASRWKTLLMLKLPAALPYIFAGLKTASVFSVVGAVIGEYLGGGLGLGVLMRLSSEQLRMDQLFALIFYLSLLGLALFGIVGWVERRTVFWQRPDPTAVMSA